jgi:RsiW-degrading membrane proteinase PrsW (M82 family)
MFRRLEFVRHTWFLVLCTGLALFAGMDVAFNVTRNLNLLPAVILLGATLVPVTFVVYVHQRVQAKDVPVGAVAVIAFLAGALGLVVAGLLEYATLRELGFLRLLGVGVVEECAKLVIPIAVYFRRRYTSEADGLLFGVASGMGFAALESMGYGLVTFLRSQGSLGNLEMTLLVRALLSPVGHAAWTGLVCAVIWRQRERAGRSVISWPVVSAFMAAVLLHTAWNMTASLTSRTSIHWIGVELLGLMAIGLTSLVLLIRRMREAGLRHPSHFSGTL